MAALSPREQEILALYPVMPETKHIAARLGLQPQTVKNHISSILDKTGTIRLGQAAILYDRSLRVSTWPEREQGERRVGERRRSERRAL